MRFTKATANECINEYVGQMITIAAIFFIETDFLKPLKHLAFRRGTSKTNMVADT